MGDRSAVKASLRTTARRARRELDAAQHRTASERACQRVVALPELRYARVVALYVPRADEVDATFAFTALAAAGVVTALPRLQEGALELVVSDDLGALTAGYRGIPEPQGPALDLDGVSAVVVPGVAFDLAGGRLGQGGGHYDDLLARLSTGCVRIGLCFSCQLVPAVPRDDHDEPVDLVVTERAAHRTGARRADPNLA